MAFRIRQGSKTPKFFHVQLDTGLWQTAKCILSFFIARDGTIQAYSTILKELPTTILSSQT